MIKNLLFFAVGVPFLCFVGLQYLLITRKYGP